MSVVEQLEAGLDTLKTVGWRQVWGFGDYVAGPEKVCAQQALTRATGGEVDSEKDEAIRQLARGMGWSEELTRDPLSFIWSWNDDDDRLPQDAVRAFELAIEDAKERECLTT